MGINRDKPDLWKKDILQSVDLYNGWFMEMECGNTRVMCTATFTAGVPRWRKDPHGRRR